MLRKILNGHLWNELLFILITNFTYFYILTSNPFNISILMLPGNVTDLQYRLK
jgi:hypothetical protein